MKNEKVINDYDFTYKVIEPVIIKFRTKNISIKYKAYSQLNDAVKALFSFHVFYQHAKESLDQFEYYYSTYIQMGFWNAIIKGI